MVGFRLFRLKYNAYMHPENTFALPYFEHQLVMYVTADDKSTFNTPFDLAAIPVVTKEQADAEDRTKKLTTVTPTIKAPKAGPTKAAPSSTEAAATASATAQKYQQELLRIPEFKTYGSVLKSSPVVELTESETEYVVTVVKHIFKEHIVLQYEVKNTLPDTVLEEVSVVATPSEEEELEEDFIIPAAKLVTDEPGTIYVSFKKVNGESAFPASSFTNVLKFSTKEIDPTTGEPEESGYDDEYQVEDLELTGSDYVIPTFAGNFNHIWEQVGAQGEEADETLQLSNMKSIAGELYIFLFKIKTDMCRCNRTTHQESFITTARGHRCADQYHYSYSQALRQDGHWRQSRCQHPDGVFLKIRCHE
jgi:coatomer protein complex subunit gamma